MVLGFLKERSIGSKGKEYWVLNERSIEFSRKGVLGLKGKEY